VWTGPGSATTRNDRLIRKTMSFVIIGRRLSSRVLGLIDALLAARS
jgi:hypothetical protein